MIRLLVAIALLLPATPAHAAPLTITKRVAIVSDPVGNLVPRSLPGAIADYRTVATNPLANLLLPVRNLVLLEPLADDVVLRVTDLAVASGGPVEFMQGDLLGLGLLGSGLTYAYSAASPTTDGLEFWDGTSWSYQPVPDAQGFDPRVRAIRVTLGATFATGGSFQLRYRTRIR